MSVLVTSTAQKCISEINNELHKVKQSFIRIGFYLKEANENKYFKELGYPTIIDFAREEFGFEKTATYGFMQVYELAHDPQDPLSIAEEFNGFTHSKLLVLSRAKCVEFCKPWTIAQPSDKEDDLKRFVKGWNEEWRIGYGYHEELKTVADYLKHYDERFGAAPKGKAVKYSGQLPGQCSMDLLEEIDEQDEQEEQNFSAGAEKLDPAPFHTDEEIIKYALLHPLYKAEIIEYYETQKPDKRDFIEYLKDLYGTGGKFTSGEYYSRIEYSGTYGIELQRLSGGFINLTWFTYGSRILKLLESGEFLQTDEVEQAIVGFDIQKPSAIDEALKEKLEAGGTKIVLDIDKPSAPAKVLDENSGEELEVYDNVTVRTETPDDELVEYCLTSDCYVAALGIKFEIYDRYFLMEPNPFFQEFIVNCYSNFSVSDKWGEGGHFDRLESDTRRGLIIHRIGGGALILEWHTVVGKIMNLIKAGKYLTDEEREKFERERARKTANEKAQRQQTRREYLATLPVGDFVTAILLEVARVYPLGKNSAGLISHMRQRMTEWFNAPHEVGVKK